MLWIGHGFVCEDEETEAAGKQKIWALTGCIQLQVSVNKIAAQSQAEFMGGWDCVV
jgi:hypothetical protein